MPLLKPSIFLCFGIGIINSFTSFDLVYVMTQGGPAHATDLLITYIYTVAFKLSKLDYAAAVTVVNFLFYLFLALLATKLSGGEAGARGHPAQTRDDRATAEPGKKRGGNSRRRRRFQRRLGASSGIRQNQAE